MWNRVNHREANNSKLRFSLSPSRLHRYLQIHRMKLKLTTPIHHTELFDAHSPFTFIK